MKDISSIEQSKEIITGHRVNKEWLYYSVLFGAATVVAIVLTVFAFVQNNKGLQIYSCILAPIFLILTGIFTRLAFVSKGRIHVKDGKLVIKSLFLTRKIRISTIDKLTAARFGDKGLTSVNVTYGNKVARYRFKNLEKEEIAHLRHATQKN